VDAVSEVQYYAEQSEFTAKFQTIGLFVAVLLAAGVAIGGMNTMYSAVFRRTHEIGVLRALGFYRTSILVSFATESMIIGAAGGALSDLIAVTLAGEMGLKNNVLHVSTLLFPLRLTTGSLVAGSLFATAIGMLGGLLPAIHAARLSITESLAK
jgi:ABC-type antimicrobial peptide transport system permease subunit